MASGHLTHPSWDSDSKRGTTDGTMRNKYDQARAQDMPIIERVHGLAERLGVPCMVRRVDVEALARSEGIGLEDGTERRLLEDVARG